MAPYGDAMAVAVVAVREKSWGGGQLPVLGLPCFVFCSSPIKPAPTMASIDTFDRFVAYC
jgi:hypothetical protein